MGSCYPRAERRESGEFLTGEALVDKIEYRWFWNISQCSSDSGQIVQYWAQYNLDLCAKIEDSYQHLQSQFVVDSNCFVRFNYERSHHLQIDKNKNHTVKVIREIPYKVENTIRIDRIETSGKETFKPYDNNYIDQLQIFCYSKIFQNFQIDESDSFIRKFTTHATLLDKKIAIFLTSDYLSYLKQVHNLEILIFDFKKLKEILSEDLKLQKAKTHSYVDYYVKDLTQENFYEKIAKMYTEEGQLYKTLNRVIRYMLFDKQMEYAFYFLCLLFIFGNREKTVEEDMTVYRGTEMGIDQYEQMRSSYAVDEVAINYNFMSTSRNINVAKSFMNNRNMACKILFKILIEKESNECPYLTFKPFDAAKVSTFPNEEEILLPPNGVFQVMKFEEEADSGYTTIEMVYRTNFFQESLEFIKGNQYRKSRISKQYGFYDFSELQGDADVDYQQIISISKDILKIDMNLFSKMRNLRELDLWNYYIGMEEMQTFAGQFIHIPNLHKLSLYNNNFQSQVTKIFAKQLVHLSNLQHLKLTENYIGNEGMKALAKELCYLSNLLHLELGRNRIGYEGISAFANEIFHLQKLQHLDLFENNIGSIGMEVLAPQLKNLPRLVNLSLLSNDLRNGGIKAIATQSTHLTNLQELNLSKNRIDMHGINDFASQLVNFAHLQTLNLYGNYLENDGITALAAQIPCCQNLLALNLGFTHIEDDGLGSLAQSIVFLTRLRELELHDNSFSEEAQSKFALTLNDLDSSWSSKDCIFKCEGLFPKPKKELFTDQFVDQSKFFEGNSLIIKKINEFHCIKNFQYYQNVESIDFSGIYIDDKDIQCFLTQLVFLPRIQRLNLSSNNLGYEAMKTFSEQLVYLPGLRWLELSQSNIGDDEMKIFAEQLKCIPYLQVLILQYNNIKAEGMTAFASQLNQLDDFQHLDLFGNKIGNTGMKAFTPHLAKLNLQFLDLSNNEIGDQEMKALATQLMSCTRLQVLNLRSNQIGTEVMEILSKQFIHFKHLNQLDLSDCQFGISGINAFAKQMHYLNHLTQLRLGSCGIDDEGVVAFASQLCHLTELQLLVLSENKLGEKGIETLAANLINLTKIELLYLGNNQCKVGSYLCHEEIISFCEQILKNKK